MSNKEVADEIALDKCIDFLNAIGIPSIVRKIDKPCFLPGFLIEDGCIVVDKDTVVYPGDILHEAGHIAVTPADKRASLNDLSIMNSDNKAAEEMMAIAWSYAACVHLELDPYFVFHEHGYKGGGGYIADNFKQKRYFGLPMLEWVGLTVSEEKAARLRVPPYPHMLKWLRE